MDMTGEYRIPAPRGRVWEALNDPGVLKAAIPGCETLEKISDEELQARVRAKVGPVNATFFGKVTLSELDPPASYRISGEGSGGVAGFAKGGAQVSLAEDGADATVLTYAAKADVGGKLAQIGSRLVQGTAKKMADEFFGNFSRIVGERYGSGETVTATAAVPGDGAAGPARTVVEPTAATAAAMGTPPPVVAPPSVDAALPPAMTAEAGAAGVPPYVPPESAPPEPVASRGASTASREASQAAHAAATDPAASQPALLSNPLVWAGIAVLVLALLFLLL